MTWKVWMDAYETVSSIKDTTIFQPMKFTDDYLIEYMRCWVVYVGAPAFNDMVMKIYGNDDQAAASTPTVLLATSENSYQLSDITTEDHGIKELWFKFNSFHVKQNNFYNFVINANGYSPNEDSYLGLEKAYPNPIQKERYTPTKLNLVQSPYKIYPVGSKL